MMVQGRECIKSEHLLLRAQIVLVLLDIRVDVNIPLPYVFVLAGKLPDYDSMIANCRLFKFTIFSIIEPKQQINNKSTTYL